MYQTLIVLGIVCIIAAAVGGGLTAFGVEIPKLTRPRVAVVFAIGAVLVVVGISTKPKPPPSAPTLSSVVTYPVGQLTASGCPVNVPVRGYITTTGGQGQVTVRLEVIWDNGNTQYSPPLTVSVNGANTYYFNDTWLVSNNTGGDFEWAVVSPMSDGSTVQPFSVSC